MNHATMLLTMAFACGTASAQGGLTWHVNPANGHAYALTAPTTWPQAESAAVQVGGHLATVRSQAENDWLVQTFYGPGAGGNYLWIGCSDAAQEGVWAWTSGEPVTYTNWAPQQPDNYSGIQHYAVMWDSPVGSWDDSEVTSIMPGIIEAVATPAFSMMGTGCLGSAGTPSLSPASNSLPRLGSTFQLDIANLPHGLTVALGALGFSDTTWGTTSLPSDLTWMGMPGCTQYVSIEATYFMLSVTGATTWAIPIPAQPWLVGSTFLVQALVPDAAANAFGATVTNAGAATIGG